MYYNIYTTGGSSDMDYPYKRNNPEYKAQVMKMFENLKSFRPMIKNWNFSVRNINNVPDSMMLYNGASKVVLVPANSYEAYDNISDYFQEEQRVRCKRFDQSMSSYEYWQKNKKSVLQLAQQSNTEPREILYQKHYECSSFKPSLMVAFSRMFPSKRVLDISSGWGDRLAGCIASPDVEYYLGSDPNSDLQSGYAEMIETFNADPESYRVVDSKFQDLDLAQEQEFDLVFTSPPYFNLEEYGKPELKSRQSYIEFNTPQAWLTEFLLPCMKKAFNKLRTGGHMIININDPPRFQNNQTTYIREMLQGMTKLPGCIYMGCIAQQEGSRKKSPQPFWIWRKTDWSEISATALDHINPPVVVDKMDSGIKIIRDDVLLGGTKQRGIVDMFSKLKESNIVYAGPNTEFAQVAVALGARLTGKNAVIFTSQSRPLTNTTKLAIRLGAVVHEGRNHEKFKMLRNRAAEYAEKNTDCVNVEFDFENTQFKTAMIQGIQSAVADKLNTEHRYTFWIVAGSAVLLRILYQVFPNSWFNVVQVGKEIDWFVDFNRSRLFIAPEWFFDNARDKPPYPSVCNYDAKVWQFVKEHGHKGDIIWNVAKDPELFDLACIDKYELIKEDGWTPVKREKNHARFNKSRGRRYR